MQDVIESEIFTLLTSYTRGADDVRGDVQGTALAPSVRRSKCTDTYSYSRRTPIMCPKTMTELEDQ